MNFHIERDIWIDIDIDWIGDRGLGRRLSLKPSCRHPVRLIQIGDGDGMGLDG